VTVIVVIICCCVSNFIKIGSRVQPLDAHINWMFNAMRPLPWESHHRGHQTWWDAIIQVSFQSVHW